MRFLPRQQEQQFSWESFALNVVAGKRREGFLCKSVAGPLPVYTGFKTVRRTNTSGPRLKQCCNVKQGTMNKGPSFFLNVIKQLRTARVPTPRHRSPGLKQSTLPLPVHTGFKTASLASLHQELISVMRRQRMGRVPESTTVSRSGMNHFLSDSAISRKDSCLRLKHVSDSMKRINNFLNICFHPKRARLAC